MFNKHTYTYDAYGNTQSNVYDDDPFGYCGEYTDKETGNIYLRARYYDPTRGAFLSEDPIQDGTNWYSYCGNNPVMFIDRMGLDYIPLKITAQSEGYTVEWNEDTSRASISGDGKYIEYYVGDGKGSFIQDDTMYVWDETYYSDTRLTDKDREAGIKIAMVDGVPYKDVSAPLDRALYQTASIAQTKWRIDYLWFYKQVNHNADWDIKRPDSWNRTIGDGTYPGFGVKVYYHGVLMTPEELGNYTYGYIGAAMGLSLTELYAGSWAAAGFPKEEADKQNEYTDRVAIEKGFNRYRGY